MQLDGDLLMLDMPGPGTYELNLFRGPSETDLALQRSTSLELAEGVNRERTLEL
jgi:hypothetical protein